MTRNSFASILLISSFHVVFAQETETSVQHRLFLLALVAVLLAVLAAYLTLDSRKRGKTAARPILLIGLSDAGKTALWTHLRYGKPAKTHTSMVENVATIPLSAVYRIDSEQEEMDSRDTNQISLVDIPGHEKLRPLIHTRLSVKEKSMLPKGIVFVIDASTFGKQVRPVTELLYDVLAEPLVMKNDTPILIVCNKQDLWSSWDQDRIRRALEHEVNQIRATRSAAVDSIRGDDQSEYLGIEGRDFTFEDVANPIEFVEASGAVERGKDENGIDKIVSWIEGL